MDAQWPNVLCITKGDNRYCRKTLALDQNNDNCEQAIATINHWGKADDRNYNYGHPKMADVESGKNLFCRLNYFYSVF